METVKEIKRCRLCGSEGLTPILSLGEQYITNFVDSDDVEVPKVPLDVVLCNPKQGGCGLLQLRHTTPPAWLYGQHYWYRSGINQTMQDELRSVTEGVEKMASLRAGDVVLDIGCNDGTLLRSYRTPSLALVGMDPASNLIPLAKEGTTKIINDFFNHDAFCREFGEVKAKVITAIAMFYDLDDPNAFVADVVKSLSPDGLFVIQQNYLVGMLGQTAFDNISHEHLEYYSLYSLENLLKRHGLEVFDVEERAINGGSFRTYIRRAGSASPDSAGGAERVRAMRVREAQLGLHDKGIYEAFASRVRGRGDKLYSFVKSETEKGKKVYVYGASTRGNTTLQFCNLDYRLIVAAAERNPDKWGRKTVGTLIPIISEAEARAAKPDYFLVLPWAFLDEFKRRETDFLKSGGKFIVPLPEFRIVDANDL
ncbi:MAG: class I SAM-dependent methyltransferase [Parcubacteria group bacterium]|nr:class I SAM-dependent methyltransferase [Parcubacteria group bacterium]